MAFQQKNYPNYRWFKFFYIEDGLVDGFGHAGAVISDVQFATPWRLENIELRFSTGNVSNTCFEVELVRTMSVSIALASTHSFYHQMLMSWMVSGSTFISLWQSFNSLRGMLYLCSGDYLHFSYSMKSNINAWSIKVEGWAVAG